MNIHPGRPLLHTWTLAVEEQFYILFPVALFLIWTFARKHLVLLLSAALGASLIFMGLRDLVGIDPPAYLLPTRMWQLLAGVLLAHLEIVRGGRSDNSFLNRIMPGVGLLLIVFAMTELVFVEGTKIPLKNVILIVCGTVSLLWFGGYGDVVSRLLSSKLFVGVGLISYSLYLWNWPIGLLLRQSFLLYNYDVSHVSLMMIMVILSFVFSWLSWRFVERPFRNRELMDRRTLMLWVLGVGGLLLGWGLYMIRSVG